MNLFHSMPSKKRCARSARYPSKCSPAPSRSDATGCSSRSASSNAGSDVSRRALCQTRRSCASEKVSIFLYMRSGVSSSNSTVPVSRNTSTHPKDQRSHAGLIPYMAAVRSGLLVASSSCELSAALELLLAELSSLSPLSPRLRSSGAQYAGVVSGTCSSASFSATAEPKSLSFTLFSARSSKTFSGFTSQCTIPIRCRWHSAESS
mmetsp:Transcript_7395/g.19715  ORF Transcript_7395/g.19715 Transcript_7395/m.19715 type:complete len:206 (-) Transcript_7395:101-718(-)